jgi:hypothetical protein
MNAMCGRGTTPVLYFVAPCAAGWRITTHGETWDFPLRTEAWVRALVYARQCAERGVGSGVRLHLGDGEWIESVDFPGAAGDDA